MFDRVADWSLCPPRNGASQPHFPPAQRGSTQRSVASVSSRQRLYVMAETEQWFVDEAEQQTRQAALVDCTDPPSLAVDSPGLTIAAFDIQWRTETDGTATCVLYRPRTASVVLTLSTAVHCRFPAYRVGFLGAREVPAFLRLLTAARQQCAAAVDVCMVDGGGQLHPRRFGSACLLGVTSGLSTIGVSKSLLRRVVAGEPTEQDVRARMEAADVQLLVLEDEQGTPVTCAVAGSRGSRKAVFVSVGHRISLLTAARIVLSCQRYVVPEPIRHADLLARQLVRAANGEEYDAQRVKGNRSIDSMRALA